MTDFGWWMAAVLACGDSAAISHADAAALWGIRVKRRKAPIQVSVPRSSRSRPAGIVVRRRTSFGRKDVTRQRGIPVTTPACTIVDIATTDSEKRLERAINDADQLGLIRFDVLRAELERMPSKRPGVATVRRLLHRHTFRLTRSELERLFLPIAKRAGLPVPETRVIVNGVEVDFYWPELGLVVETDSLRYHRTPATQTSDIVRDQTHFARGLIPLRFTHWQVAKEPRYVEKMLRYARRHLPAPGAVARA